MRHYGLSARLNYLKISAESKLEMFLGNRGIQDTTLELDPNFVAGLIYNGLSQNLEVLQQRGEWELLEGEICR